MWGHPPARLRRYSCPESGKPVLVTVTTLSLRDSQCPGSVSMREGHGRGVAGPSSAKSLCGRAVPSPAEAPSSCRVPRMPPQSLVLVARGLPGYSPHLLLMALLPHDQATPDGCVFSMVKGSPCLGPWACPLGLTEVTGADWGQVPRKKWILF